MSGEMQIGIVAKSAGVSRQTVMYYERRGLIGPRSRSASGYRMYAPEAVDRIRFIKNAQCLGFTLKEAGQLLRLRVKKKGDCASIKKKTSAKLSAVRRKIAGLAALERVLRELVDACGRGLPTGTCPVLDSLDAEAPPAARFENGR